MDKDIAMKEQEISENKSQITNHVHIVRMSQLTTNIDISLVFIALFINGREKFENHLLNIR